MCHCFFSKSNVEEHRPPELAIVAKLSFTAHKCLTHKPQNALKDYCTCTQAS